MAEPRTILAVFIDFENLALGFKGRTDTFDIGRVLARLVEKGNIVVKRAYCDWIRFANYAPAMHETAIELLQIPRRHMTGKNSADMRLCVDAMDLCYSKSHIDTFVIVSGDSDFSPLVSKLKENGKQVIGLGMRESTSDLLRDNCDEFIYYESLEAVSEGDVSRLAGLEPRKQEVFTQLLDSMQAMRRANRDRLWSSMIKETMMRKHPSFSESDYGYSSFSRLLEDAKEHGLVELTRDAADRTYIVARFGDEMSGAEQEVDEASEVPAKTAVKRRSRPRRRTKRPVEE